MSGTRLAAWRDAGILCATFNDEEDTIVFSNGEVLPVFAYTDSTKTKYLTEPIDGGFACFGDEEHGYGYYPIKLITQEEWDAEQERQASPLHGSGRA